MMRRPCGIFFCLWIGILCGGDLSGQEDAGNLIAFQKELIETLAGGTEIAAGNHLENRATPENRSKVRAYLSEILASLGLEPRLHPYREDGENVYALLPATAQREEEYVVLGAHFDTSGRSPGANDNATGCALVLAVARRLSALPNRQKNLIIVLFDEEERGLQGSRAFAQMLLDEERRVVAVHTVDQVGWDGDGDGAIELELPYEGALDLYRAAAQRVGSSSPIHVTEEAGSDHTAFRRSGFAAVGITEEYRNGDTTPHIHRPTDTWETVDFEYLAAATRLVGEAMALLIGETGG